MASQPHAAGRFFLKKQGFVMAAKERGARWIRDPREEPVLAQAGRAFQSLSAGLPGFAFAMALTVLRL